MWYICMSACVKPKGQNAKHKTPNLEIQAIVHREMSFTSTNPKIHRTKWLQSCAGHSLTVLGSASRKSCHSSPQIPNGSSLHRLVWSTSMFGNKCRITLHCLRGRIHRSSPQAGESLGLPQQHGMSEMSACLNRENIWGLHTRKTWWCNVCEAMTVLGRFGTGQAVWAP